MSLLILAIETSCDDTSASVLKDAQVLSNVISTQHIHKYYGGIVPELASRSQLEMIDIIVNDALTASAAELKDIDIFASTKGPGLIGSLLVGLNYTKTLSLVFNKKFYGINHIEGHLYSSFIGKENPEFPFISLIVSGGHTLLFLVKDYFEYVLLGQTQDDACGEAFDKVGKLLGFDYPAGQQIDTLSKSGNENFYKFPNSNIKSNKYDFSFSGIKTSVLYFLRRNYPDFINTKDSSVIPLEDICASFQKAVISDLITRVISAAEEYDVKTISVSGGVSQNSKLREELKKYESEKLKVLFPEAAYTTDNAAMIGYTAYLKDKFKGYDENSLYQPAFPKFVSL